MFLRNSIFKTINLDVTNIIIYLTRTIVLHKTNLPIGQFVKKLKT